MTDTSGFAKFVPGFDFLQSLVSNAGASLPNVGQWIVPTLDPDELEKRINELRTVQFWLDQNSRMLATTIQALEVQRMTLSTLRGMNVSMGDLQSGLTAQAAAPEAAPSDTPPPAAAGASAVDPMQWWGSLTQQFSKLAADAMRQATDAAGPVAAAAHAATTAATAATKAAAQATQAAVPPVPRKARPATKGSTRGGGPQSESA